jgi:asparagine synthase (glutamine-hydrolysing)
MAFSIESRVPYLDHDLVELVLSFPPEFKIHEGWTKYVQRRAAADALPSDIVWRRDKLGFTTPQAAWRRELAGPLREIVRAAELPAFLDRTEVARLIETHDGRATTLSELWKTVSLVKWIQSYNVVFEEQPA